LAQPGLPGKGIGGDIPKKKPDDVASGKFDILATYTYTYTSRRSTPRQAA
jgi:hypothetical protein